MKKIAASDSRQSVGLKWKTRKGLEKIIDFDFDRNKTILGGDLEVEGKALYLGGKEAYLYSYQENGDNLVDIRVREDGNIYKVALTISVSPQGDVRILQKGTDQLLASSDLDGIFQQIFALASQRFSMAKYQHTVTLKGDGFEFCFTAQSSNDTNIDSYQNLHTVFNSERISLTGYSAALSARPVSIDLHGGTVDSDFIRVYKEAGGGFSDVTISEIGTIIYDDYVNALS